MEEALQVCGSFQGTSRQEETSKRETENQEEMVDLKAGRSVISSDGVPQARQLVEHEAGHFGRVFADALENHVSVFACFPEA